MRLSTFFQSRLFGLALLSLCLLPACTNDAVRPPEEAEKHFVFEVYPLIQSKCLACHGDDPKEIKGELDLRTRQGWMEGGESGHPCLELGKPEKSTAMMAVRRGDPDFKMPPKDNDQLSKDQIADLEEWIAADAPWPDSAKRAFIFAADDWDFGGKVRVATSGGLSQEWTHRRYDSSALWAFQPLSEIRVPQSAAAHPIDAFINASLHAEGLESGPLAEKRTLLRRLTYDLTGLPPSPEEMEFFLKDESEDAYEKQIDRLLASPQYGEQWGRHWLDVVRYADSDGFANDHVRPNAWRYRDYVVRAFHEDKPYDQFIREQIAGDEIDPADPEKLIATGFLRMGPWEHTFMSVAAETRQYFLDDVTNAVGETFLSLPLRCARCHDHKFDPIPTRDYYRVQAVFATTQFAEREAAFLPAENRELFEEEKQQIEKWIGEADEGEKAISKKEENAAKNWYMKRGKRYLPKRKRMKLPENQRPPRYLGLTFQDLGYRKVLNKRQQTLKRELGGFEPLAYSVYNGPDRILYSHRPMRVPDKIEDHPKATFILTGGSVYTPSDGVSPGILSAIITLDKPEHPQLNEMVHKPLIETMDQRRLQFARWLTESKNPLVLRSIVNRIWNWHFGQGLAGNPNNFGATGKQPIHPELLDWLAHYFADNGWSIKKLHRLILTAEAYQRATGTRTENDPDNLYYSVFSPRRLEAEELRDAMLLVSGELNFKAGGIPARPEIHQEVALQPRHIMGSIARAYQPSPTPDQRNRRSLYALRLRGLPDPLMEVFNQPNPDFSCEQRSSSTVSPQVLTLLNGEHTRSRSLAMAVRLEKEASTLDAQIERGMKLAWNRSPQNGEQQLSREYVAEMVKYHQAHLPERKIYPTEVKRKMFEEMTGEPFEYVERLDVYKNYEPGLQAIDLKPETRALADYCMVLLNANEFLYVY